MSVNRLLWFTGSNRIEIHRKMTDVYAEKCMDIKKCERGVGSSQKAVEHKKKHIESARKFLHRYREEGETLLDSIVIGDVTWVHYFTP